MGALLALGTITTIDLSGNSKITGNECVGIMDCYATGSVTCIFDQQVCDKTSSPTMSPTGSPTTPSPTMSPTPPTYAPTPSPTFATIPPWQMFFDASNGVNWDRFVGRRDDPCGASANNRYITCDMYGEITDIKLNNNNLKGEVPTAYLREMFDATLRFLDISSNPKLTASSCLDLPQCAWANYTCVLPDGMILCHNTLSPTMAPSFSPTPPTIPTPLPTMSPLPFEIAAWREFFIATGGEMWNRCSNKAEDPCTCSPTTQPTRKVVCKNDGTIDKIKMVNNNLISSDFPTAAIQDLISQGLTVLDLSNNDGLQSTTCLDLPECYSTGSLTCSFPPTLTLCESTLAPSMAPTGSPVLPTPLPTGSPTIITGPTTASPTNSPTSLSPSMSPTSSPVAPTPRPSRNVATLSAPNYVLVAICLVILQVLHP